MEMKEDGEAGGGGGMTGDMSRGRGRKNVTMIKLAFEISKTKSFTKELRMMKMMVIMMTKKPSIITEQKETQKERE